MLYTHNIEQHNEGRFLILLEKNYLSCNRSVSGFFEVYNYVHLIVSLAFLLFKRNSDNVRA